ncbi:MAG TPA: BON domain-containing protein [Blastocatellia bacterium]|nr:BON domain-containing protein [Blastocatellia bacterium]
MAYDDYDYDRERYDRGRYSRGYSNEPWERRYGSRGGYSEPSRFGYSGSTYSEPYRGSYGSSSYNEPYRAGYGSSNEPWERGYGYSREGFSGGYYGEPYRRGEYERGREGYGREGYGREDRGFWDRASDEVRSWFGDEEAERRRRMDERYGERGMHTGRGPKGYQRSDERIREDVNDRLSDHPYLDASEIEVAVSNGEVTLTGTVDQRWAKRTAEDIAENVSGVKDVHNNLKVTPQTWAQTQGQQTTTDQAAQRTRTARS